MGKPFISPIHRDPDSGDCDYGCFTAAANKQVGKLVRNIQQDLHNNHFIDGTELIRIMRTVLSFIGEGASDTIVKENVRNAIFEDVEKAGLDVDWMDIYGW